jgi:hypothetical protein
MTYLENTNEMKFLSSDTTQLIMKVVMHELDYDMDDDDLNFLDELNQYIKSQGIFQLIFCFFVF